MSSHKIELAIQDVPESSDLNNEYNTDFVKIFLTYSFWKSKYERPRDTRWVEHQCVALNSHVSNLPIFMEFCNNQTFNPHDTQIKNIVPKH